ncbi:MAG TPA: hypothetical protein VMG30_05540 [Acidobacteriota bacterium]|nr:hypothetical protein [Acidobacteriota bacterium]
MARELSNEERRKLKEATKKQFQGFLENQENAPIRVGMFGKHWQSLTVSEFAEGLGLQINFAGFWDISESGKKVEGQHSSGYKFIMDGTRSYYRVQNADGDYVDAQGRTLGDPPYHGDQDAFNKASHFANKSAKTKE